MRDPSQLVWLVKKINKSCFQRVHFLQTAAFGGGLEEMGWFLIAFF